MKIVFLANFKNQFLPERALIDGKEHRVLHFEDRIEFEKIDEKKEKPLHDRGAVTGMAMLSFDGHGMDHVGNPLHNAELQINRLQNEVEIHKKRVNELMINIFDRVNVSQ